MVNGRHIGNIFIYNTTMAFLICTDFRMKDAKSHHCIGWTSKISNFETSWWLADLPGNSDTTVYCC